MSVRSRIEHSGAFGHDAFGRGAERTARFFGTPHYIVGQTLVVIAWIGLNSVAVVYRWDPYPFILLNLAFSTQAAYAAPLILLAQTRQADRDKAESERVDERHSALERAAADRVGLIKAETDELRSLLVTNTELTEQVARLTREIHALLRARS